jgi:hypothetical protein
MKEVKKEIKGYGGIYLISNRGFIYSRYRVGPSGKLQDKYRKLKNSIGGKGYVTCHLYKDKKRETVKPHRLVAEYFIGKIPKGYEVNHLDCDKTNTHVSNLEICTVSENKKHAYKHGLITVPRKRKLTDKQVLDIYNSDIKNIELSRIHSVHNSVICRIKNGESYGYLTGHVR